MISPTDSPDKRSQEVLNRLQPERRIIKVFSKRVVCDWDIALVRTFKKLKRLFEGGNKQ